MRHRVRQTDRQTERHHIIYTLSQHHSTFDLSTHTAAPPTAAPGPSPLTGQWTALIEGASSATAVKKGRTYGPNWREWNTDDAKVHSCVDNSLVTILEKSCMQLKKTSGSKRPALD